MVLINSWYLISTEGGDLLGRTCEEPGDLVESAGVLVLDTCHLFSVPLHLRMKKGHSLQNTGILLLREIRQNKVEKNGTGIHIDIYIQIIVQRFLPTFTLIYSLPCVLEELAKM